MSEFETVSESELQSIEGGALPAALGAAGLVANGILWGMTAGVVILGIYLAATS